MLFGKHINQYYLRYFWAFVLGIAALIAVDYFQLLVPELLAKIINETSEGNLTFDFLSGICTNILIIAFVMFLGRFTWRLTLFGGAVRIQSDLREKMFIYSEKLSQRYYKENKTGALMALFTNDLETIEEAFGSGTIMMIDAFFLGGLAFYKMFRLNWMLALMALIPLAILAICGVFVGRVMSMKFEKRQKAYDELSDFSQENFSGIRVIKAFVKEVQEMRAFAKVNEFNRQANLEMARYATKIDVLIGLLTNSMVIIIYLIGGFLVFLTSKETPGIDFKVGNITEFIGYFDALIWPMMALAQIINLRSRAKTSLRRVSALLDEKIDIKDDQIVFVEELKGKIQFDHLDFKYPDGDDTVLKDISFTIEAGESVGIIGKIGSGKSTLINILLRLYNIENNKVFVDDIDLMKLPIKKVRENIGYVPQDNFLFSDTIKNNIAFAEQNIDNDKIEDAAEFADVKENIVAFKDGFNTVTGERGVTLSGGQKQRISISRAILKNPSILILDDSVSAVDLKTEEKILSNIGKHRQGKTTLLIASRVSTVQKLDKILVMNDGRVEAFGTHKELLKTSSTYKHMVELQRLENEVENDGRE